MGYSMSNPFKNINHKLYITPDSKLLSGCFNEINPTKDTFSIKDCYFDRIRFNENVLKWVNDDLVIFYYIYGSYINIVTKDENDYILWRLKYGL